MKERHLRKLFRCQQQLLYLGKKLQVHKQEPFHQGKNLVSFPRFLCILLSPKIVKNMLSSIITLMKTSPILVIGEVTHTWSLELL